MTHAASDTACLICLGDLARGRAPEPDSAYHRRCIQALLGSAYVPTIDVELAKLHTLALTMVGRASISGVQRKISFGLSADRLTLQVAVRGARFILKPQAGTFPNLPENEHLTMRLAALWGIHVPPCGIVRLADASLAYLVARFDRPAGGGKLHQEDLCQLAELPPKDKYQGSAELCVRLLRRYTTEPLVEVLKLFNILVFAWWTGNGDLHLKNLSLTVDRASGVAKLTPAYDLLNTRLVIPGDSLALTVDGKTDNVKRKTWLRLAQYAGIPERAAARVLATAARKLDAAGGLVERSLLPQPMREEYAELLSERAADLLPPTQRIAGLCE